MTKKFIFELFPARLALQGDPEHFIEVFDFHETTYGTIFYKGKKIYVYEGEAYFPKLTRFTTIKKMTDMGLDVQKATVIFYDLSMIQDVCHGLPNFDYQDSQFSPYSKLFKDIQADLLSIETLIQNKEAELQKKFPNVSVNFIHIHKLEDYN